MAVNLERLVPRQRSHLLLALGLCPAIGFALGTVTLLGPIHWLTKGVQRIGFSAPAQNSLVLVVIGLYLLVTLVLTLVLAAIGLRTERRSVKFGVPVLATALAASSLWLWMTPEVVGRLIAREATSVARFSFGPYPNRARFEQLRAEGVTAVISLLHPGVVPFEPVLRARERALAAEVGVELIEAPMLPWISENTESLALIRNLAETGKGHYYVHCYLGRDRVVSVETLLRRLYRDGDAVVEPGAARRLRERRAFVIGAFERGPIREIDRDVWLIPYPTLGEFEDYVLSGDVQHVLSLLDPGNLEDVAWIEMEERLTRELALPYSLMPLSWAAYDPEAVLAAARKARRLPRPLVVHAFRSDVGVARAFVAAYMTDRAPLFPEAFDQPLLGGKAEQIAPHIAMGPRPDGREFGTFLARAGVRDIAWVGPNGGSRAFDDRIVVTTETNLRWHEVAPEQAAVLRLLNSGGPWYVYGPGLGSLQEGIRRHFSTSYQHAAENDAVTGPVRVFAAVRILLEAAVPTSRMVVTLGPLLLACGLLGAMLAGWLRTRVGVRTSYTRKVFHFFIFTVAGVVQIVWGFAAVCLFGTLVSALVLYAVWRGEGFAFYEAMARESDRPRRSLFILVPLATTVIGGLASNLLFPQFGFIGYLVCGWGDAVGEPVGARWGRHVYRVPSIAGVPARRSVEGSLAVWLGGSAAAAAGLYFVGVPAAIAVVTGLACGLIGAAVEAVSSHGFDNLTIQVATSLTAFLLLG